MIKSNEDDLVTNDQNLKDETAARMKANAAYQEKHHEDKKRLDI